MVKVKSRTEESTQLAKERRKQILKAAIRCFRKRGFHQTTLRDIAAEFGMSVGHIYNYFESKEAIIEAMVEDSTNRFKVMITQEKLSRSSTDSVVQRENLNHVVEAFLDPEIAPLAVAIMNEAMINPRVYEITVEATTRIREHIIRTYFTGFDEEYRGRIPSEIAETRIISFRSILEGLRMAILFNPKADRELLKKITVDRILKIIEMEREEDRRLYGQQ
ncbi:TetR family transcriptional regulator [gut metagenome]|uniref:TetR family transcriptional regulator n=1 Tax=gut metagenome TaxID=749906 RepID=J9H813_9ZZZZ